MLNDKQKQAVAHKEGALLILAGAGAGKTRVIVHRIAELIRSGVAPESIVAVTFTNKAAREMRERVGVLLERDPALFDYGNPLERGAERSSPFIGTFHALSLHIIKTFHQEVGLPKRFTIFDRSDSQRALKSAIEEAGFDPKELEPRRVLAVMGRAKGEALDVEGFRNERASSYIDEAIAEVWGKYERALKKEHALDFDDILLTAHQLLKKEGPRTHFTNTWHYLLIDEYQDTNRVQYEIVKAISGDRGNVAAVGDVDQNIYSWRGASIEHIMNFERDFPDASVVVLDENYRSTKTILAAANDAIARNVKRREKNLYTANDDGERIRVGGFVDETEEAGFVANESRRLIKAGADPSSIAVLYRANFQSRILEEAFLSRDIPYQVLGTRFFERKEVKDALSYIKYAMNPESVGDFVRAIASPPRGIGKVTIAKVVAKDEATLPASARGKIEAFRQNIARMRVAIDTMKTSDAVRMVITDSGLYKLYETGIDEDSERLENLKELVTVASKYDALPTPTGIEKLIEDATLQSDQDELADKEAEKKKGVKLMTVHAAKGLEFDAVFVTGLEEGLFPHERDNSDNVDDEEERRLFYVALTRAKKLAYLTYAVTRRIFGTRSMNAPSEFISELDPAYAELVAVPLHDFEPRDTIY